MPYSFYDNGGELMFFRDTQVAVGSVDILAALQWEVANGYAKATDVPTQLEYGVEIVHHWHRDLPDGRPDLNLSS